MKNLPDKNLIRDIAIELQLDESFVEKDWFATQLLILLTQHHNNRGVNLIFSGGTSLSKGHNLIQRFSEDL